MKKLFSKKSKAQSAVEYALLAAAVAIAFSTSFYYLHRIVDGKLKTIERMINTSINEE